MILPIFLLLYFISSIVLSIVYYDYNAAFYLIFSNLIVMTLIIKKKILVSFLKPYIDKDPYVPMGLGIFQCFYMIIIAPIFLFKLMVTIVSYFTA